MIDPVNIFESHVAARILDFLDERTRWNRQLWNIGLSLTLQEALEAAAAVRAGALHPAALDFLCGTAQKLVGTDPGAGSPQERQVLQFALKSKLRPEGLDYYVVEQQHAALNLGYFARWANALRGPILCGAERTARAIVTHLFGSWLQFRLSPPMVELSIET
jgi:hypothetical protein